MKITDPLNDFKRIPVDFIVGRVGMHPTGIGRFLGELISNLERVDARIIDFRSPLGFNQVGRFLSLTFFPHKAKIYARDRSVKHFSSQIQSHVLNFYELRPSIVTCYDFHPLISNEYPLTDRLTAYLGVKGMLKADMICCVSDFVAREVQRHLQVSPDRIKVIHPGIDHRRFNPSPEKEESRKKLGLPTRKRIFLFVGSEQPRKNLPFLLRALRILQREGMDFILLKLGKPQYKGARASTQKIAAEQGILDRVIFVNEVSENELPLYYRAADVLAFPSLYEGFGLPLLEAMACGCPVVALKKASIPEVVEDAGILLEDENPQEFAEALARVASDDRLASELSDRGIKRASLFSWGKTARLHFQLYEKLLEGS